MQQHSMDLSDKIDQFLRERNFKIFVTVKIENREIRF